MLSSSCSRLVDIIPCKPDKNLLKLSLTDSPSSSMFVCTTDKLLKAPAETDRKYVPY